MIISCQDCLLQSRQGHLIATSWISELPHLERAGGYHRAGTPQVPCHTSHMTPLQLQSRVPLIIFVLLLLWDTGEWDTHVHTTQSSTRCLVLLALLCKYSHIQIQFQLNWKSRVIYDLSLHNVDGHIWSYLIFLHDCKNCLLMLRGQTWSRGWGHMGRYWRFLLGKREQLEANMRYKSDWTVRSVGGKVETRYNNNGGEGRATRLPNDLFPK